jgi:hypothetical protein
MQDALGGVSNPNTGRKVRENTGTELPTRLEPNLN